MSETDPAVLTMIRNLEAKTGRSLSDWVVLARGTGLGKHKAMVDSLKADHGLTHGYANLVAMTALKSADEPEGEALVDAQYGAAKAALRPLYERIVAHVRSLGPDVEVAPKKAYVSLRRTKQFALLQPSTAARLDIGLNLKGVEPSGRLEASGSFNAMCTHRVKVQADSDVDAELLGWLQDAYSRA